MARTKALCSIDVHNHVLQNEWFADLRKDHDRFVPELIEETSSSQKFSLKVGVSGIQARFIPETMFGLKKRRAELKRLRIDFQVLSAVPFLFFYDLPRESAVNLNRAQNEGIARVVRDYSDDFIGLCTVPLQDPSSAASELEHAVTNLGLKGVEIGSNINSVNLDDRSLWPFYKKVQELRVPIMVHPVSSGFRRLDRYYLGNFLGNPLETSIAISSIVFGGVLESFPRLKFYFVHGGGFVPYQRGRLSHGFKVRPEPKEIIKRDPEFYLKQIYFDSVLHYAPALEYLIKTHGANRILLGSDYPFDMKVSRPVDNVSDRNISAIDKARVLEENAAELFSMKLR
ncbi:MAG: amidohydrolase [Nitrososphaerota archaeon]|nr:amidohydrolase [Nitrososphaerota archaeon]